MIRFCDREIDYIEYASLTRIELLEYFLSDHKDDMLCVYDSFTTMNYIGIITFASLQHSINVDGAIKKEYVIFNSEIWKNAREYFRYKSRNLSVDMLLPVLDNKCKLMCFAYEDEDANREIRMLYELQKTPSALQFVDIYPEVKCVKIYGFNELAYLFAEYLKNIGILVEAVDSMWIPFYEVGKYAGPEYECLMIHAEGVNGKCSNWKENLLRSASVEFECIDKIYEMNIKSGAIQNANGDCKALLKRLKNEEAVVIYGTGREAQAAYDFLVKNGIDICCFIDTSESTHRLFGKKIISEIDAIRMYKAAVFIDCSNQYSAWGMGQTDYFDYIGYRRNIGFILLKDYVDVTENNLLNALESEKVVLLGDMHLCRRLCDYLIQNNVFVIGYLHTQPEDVLLNGLPEVRLEEIDEETICLLVTPHYFTYNTFSWKGEVQKKELIEYLKKNNINNYTDYFSEMSSFIALEAKYDAKYTKEWLIPQRIVLGSIEAYNGNDFFRGLLDSHPSIAMIHYSDLNNNLFWICLRLSMEKTENIRFALWKMIEGDEKWIFDPSSFNEKLDELLAIDNKFTSQELFTMIHIAYMHMCRKNEIEIDIRNMIIYWEPHCMKREQMEDFADWLGTNTVHCDIINVVRNICMQNGSAIKDIQDNGINQVFCRILQYPNIDKKEYIHSHRVIVKFEDLKCNPQNTLMEICDKWGIEWSDILMQTTRFGKECSYSDKVHTVKGFDLQPVYNIYENFFSEFDRFRMVIINAPWQRKYGYPYVEITRFSKRELQEMFLHEFRFEDLDKEGLWKCNLDNRVLLQMDIRKKMQKVRMLEMKERYVL